MSKAIGATDLPPRAGRMALGVDDQGLRLLRGLAPAYHPWLLWSQLYGPP